MRYPTPRPPTVAEIEAYALEIEDYDEATYRREVAEEIGHPQHWAELDESEEAIGEKAKRSSLRMPAAQVAGISSTVLQRVFEDNPQLHFEGDGRPRARHARAQSAHRRAPDRAGDGWADRDEAEEALSDERIRELNGESEADRVIDEMEFIWID